VAPVEPPAVQGATARGAAAVGEPASGEALNGALSGEARPADSSPGAGERRPRLPSPLPPPWPRGTHGAPGWASAAPEGPAPGTPAAGGWAGAGAAAIDLPVEPGIAGAAVTAATGGPGALPPGVAGAALASSGPAAATPTPAPWPAPPRDHQGFLHGAAILAPVETRARRDAAGAGLVVDAGTVLPAALLTAVDSDVAGPLVAQVTRDVFDRDQRRVAIPRGSRLLGAYDSQVALGESRLLVAWTRVIFPDGTGLSFPGLPAATPAGEAGLPGSVDSHLARVFGGALLLSVVGAGAQLSQPQESTAFGTAASARQIAAAAVGQQLSSVAIELLRRQLSVPPTIRIAAGTAFNVLLRGDLRLEAAPVE
jgi:type IV secretory pathway VirB10-like protein